jgi:MFS transporter, DHA2 family, lincomycin resistance protein
VGVMVFFLNISPTTPLWSFIVIYIVLMVSISAIMMPSQTNALNELPKKLYPHGTAIANTLQPISGALGVSIFVSIMSHGQKAYVEDSGEPVTDSVLDAAMTQGVHNAYWFALALCCAAFVTAIFIKKAVAPDFDEE